MDTPANQVVCPECGRVRLETPPGTRVLPTLGMARKAAGTAGECGCGRHRPEHIGDAPTAYDRAATDAGPNS